MGVVDGVVVGVVAGVAGEFGRRPKTTPRTTEVNTIMMANDTIATEKNDHIQIFVHILLSFLHSL